MPKKPTKPLILGAYFKWRLGERDGVYYADGRTNKPSVGRHSLNTRNLDKAKLAISALDQSLALKYGLATPITTGAEQPTVLPLRDGWELYKTHVSRARSIGGAKPKTVQRYKAKVDKFIKFSVQRGVETWNRVTTSHLEAYSRWLEDNDFALRTQSGELTTIKQVINHLTEDGHLINGPRINLSVVKYDETDTYCWSPDEVNAIIDYCRQNAKLNWLADIYIGLATTGLRIMEFSSLRVSDIDRSGAGLPMIRLTDESARANKRIRGKKRETKSGRSRSLPVNNELLPIVDRLSKGRDGLLFRGPRGGKLTDDVVRDNLVKRILPALAKKFPTLEDQIGFADGRLHSFRHYFCSRCANEGVPEAVVMRWLGHKDSKMVRLYYHLKDQESQRHMQRLRFVDTAGGTVPPAVPGTASTTAVEPEVK